MKPNVALGYSEFYESYFLALFIHLLLEVQYVFCFQKIVMVSAIWKKVGQFHY